jgi:hypothetical protein
MSDDLLLDFIEARRKAGGAGLLARLAELLREDELPCDCEECELEGLSE